MYLSRSKSCKVIHVLSPVNAWIPQRKMTSDDDDVYLKKITTRVSKNLSPY
jgi:hypothetical protein